ncbi:tRNA (5-methoxyuridine) 34 synthase [Klebsiella pneumoniae]|nr:tRNA (5-methoxyuridine) 34 synthase [Klebsiella pneumoniae]
MIDFSNFYQQIAKSPLSHWLETLPAPGSRLAARCPARQVS